MKKILLIDDEVDFCDLVKVRLESNDFEVVTAHDGQEGIGKAKSEDPDIILMDIMMPNMNGGDAVRLLKSDPKTSSIPVIFLTAVVTQEDEESGQQVNIDESFFPAIAKPFKPDLFISKINKILNDSK